ncbi:MAG: malonyl-ACP O-methyltransferase BioC [Nitrospina sp.]|nr:malonyl-ACP O-methyltransferase BioC [Nitrospina sp.]MBT3875889.1 malonyl-ACP O-methyltransferase BioC [Nitrospina sp.]MBT4046976.1 malonyl-ACP O-methyltransferase BioC [Nitrospina sp.]MBT4557304.1 malonyl-ACP O-methyltransferase BioC [Nitrospina sp.]MBT5347576.1 malonyl-ACP O-methyltransferase BioC [Nitrospina sp.]
MNSYDDSLIDSFSKHAKTYDRYAQLQRSMAERLASLLPDSLPSNVLEIGCGTGLFSRHLLTQPIKKLILNDISPGMLEILNNSLSLPANTKIVPGNAERLSFENLDLICANAVFQWFQDPQETLIKLNQALRIKGELIFSTFGPKTLIEFREAANLMSPIELYDSETWLRMIKNAGFIIKGCDVEIRKIFFSSTMTLLKNLQQIGAAPIRMLKTGGLRKLMREYDSRFSTTQGVYATWELYYFSMDREN